VTLWSVFNCPGFRGNIIVPSQQPCLSGTRKEPSNSSFLNGNLSALALQQCNSRMDMGPQQHHVQGCRWHPCSRHRAWGGSQYRPDPEKAMQLGMSTESPVTATAMRLSFHNSMFCAALAQVWVVMRCMDTPEPGECSSAGITALPHAPRIPKLCCDDVCDLHRGRAAKCTPGSDHRPHFANIFWGWVSF
jgi:hypothetical protein